MGKQTGYNMNKMRDYFVNKGFKFSHEILSRYYLSLKTKPFVILIGISGTGKTKIAQIFADYICQSIDDEKEKRIAFISVRPDWMDNRGLLGYFNVLQDKYVQTDLLKLLIEAGKKENKEKPYFVILDEMNLAKVEYYFSDFLSILESRTSTKPEGEFISLYDVTQFEKVFSEKELEEKTGVPHKIHIPSNVFFTGTVNVDESTYMFSPKVLDRANVIEFNEVVLPGMTEKFKFDNFRIEETKGLISDFKSASHICSITDYENLYEKNKDCAESIVELLNLLKGSEEQTYNMHFGYRVANEMAYFIMLSSKKIENFNWKIALDVQILQKVLPKFHGTRAKLEAPINDLIQFCSEKEFTRSSTKLNAMKKNLEANGYASFIE